MSFSSEKEKDKHLLEINLDNLATTNEEIQTYWLLAIHVSREARILRTETTQHQKETPHDERANYLISQQEISPATSRI